MREGVSKKPKAPVREGLATLTEFLDTQDMAGSISSALERSEVVIAAESIVEKLQDMAEDLSTVEAKDIMPLLDSLTTAFGPEVAQKFNSVATEQVRQLISSVQAAKTALDGEILRMKKGIETGQVSDMSMDASKPMMPSGDMGGEPAPGMEPGADMQPAGALPEVPPDTAGNADDAMVGGDFSGRSKKEGAVPRGKALAGKRNPVKEDVGMPHSHESGNFAGNISNLSLFHGGAGKLAQGIANMIRTEELSLDQRQGFANVLSHLAAFAAEPAHWSGVDADQKLQMALQSAGIWETKTPATLKIKGQLSRLAHLLSLHHDRVLENNVMRLRKADNPDALILKTFRTKLAEHRDGQMAAIRTARTFAIDIEDVVAVVREAAARRPFKKLDEDETPVVPMFPVEQTTAVTAQPPHWGSPPAPQQNAMAEPANQSQSTQRPLSAADMRQRAANQTQQPQQQPQQSQLVQAQQPQPGQPQPQQPQRPVQQPQQPQAVQAQTPQFQMPGNVLNKNDPALKRAQMASKG